MAAKIIDGRQIANRIKAKVKREILNLRLKKRRVPRLVSLQIGKNAPSFLYSNAQTRLANELGIEYHTKTLDARASQSSIIVEIDRLNRDKNTTGIIIHTPVPRHISLCELFARIAPDKDAEGLSPHNMGRLVYGDWIIGPCTASACMTLLESTGIKLPGKEAVIIGHSEIVGKPLSLMMLSKLATTSVCHIGTYQRGHLKRHVERAEVLIVSVGKANLIKGDWVRKGAVVIDVGINRYKGRITGDVQFEGAVKRASYITPVPGGVGPVTAITLMRNLVKLQKSQNKVRS